MQAPGDLMGYDRAITLFSPDGRILQVEYARKTVAQGSAAVGLVGKDSVVFVADKRLPEYDKLIVPESIEKIFKIDEHIAAAISGMIADGRALIEKAQTNAQQYKVTYNEDADLLLIIKGISTEMQVLTQYGGARPYGVSILFGGIKSGKPVLYMLEPSGIFFQYKAVAIGENAEAINKPLGEDYKPDMSQEELIKLGIKSMKAAGIKLSHERFDIGILSSSGFKKLDKEEATGYL
ncbi:archaeal proteasome endopeptidase complex subunit alpha [Candidatus Parvarchaeota archaeon]|nr:archaeal proteasome endopeptidase complex subunit alpha [Candidatus Parvarchaeota archaeon]